MKEEDIVDAVYRAVVDHIYSVVPPKRIEDVEVSVSIGEGDEIIIEVQLVTDRSPEIDQRTVEEAVKIGSEKADELMKSQ